ncbi:MutS-related protein [Marinifilum sp. RC60d5]|uniref:MutS-related protein n=1 Tax=Marinifilum sp. RC60d5 TaxID=3458414 RepID=UPI00403535E8
MKQNYYQNRIKAFRKETALLQKTNKRLSAFRLLSAVAAFVLFYVILPYSMLAAISVAVFLISALSYFVRKYGKNDKKIKKLNLLADINANEISCLNTRHNDLFYNGKEYLEANHPYASDLDIYGSHSLYQLINRCVSKSGNDSLGKCLNEPSANKLIKERQEAVKELSTQIDWRQNIIQYGLSKKLKNDNPDFVSDWGKMSSPFHNNKGLFRVISILPFFSFAAIIYSFIGSSIPLLLLFVLSFAIHYRNNKNVDKAYSNTSNKGSMLRIYAFIIEEFENRTWESKKLSSLKKKLESKDLSASKKIRRLSRLIEMLDQRHNMLVQIIFNALFFYDLHLLYRIDKWKTNYGHEIENWFTSIGEIETLSSFANLSFNHPEWVFPEVTDEHFKLAMKEAGHPMIDENVRVNNDYELNGPGVIHIVTGSNMAGKSTFLRTIGVNIVLALSGAPVCAKEMLVSNVEVNTSMRIKDSIEDNESSFYAELKRIQQVLEKVNKQENTLLLLDEILRGTNSKDKHTGSRALIKQLVKQNAVGLVATHDLELSVLEDELPGKVENRFFDIKIDGDELYFDYKVQHGFCKTFNAPILMKKMGIEMELIND